MNALVILQHDSNIVYYVVVLCGCPIASRMIGGYGGLQYNDMRTSIDLRDGTGLTITECLNCNFSQAKASWLVSGKQRGLGLVILFNYVSFAILISSAECCCCFGYSPVVVYHRCLSLLPIALYGNVTLLQN